MQFIEGHSLTELIKELRRLEGLEPVDMPCATSAGLATSTPAAQRASGRLSRVPGPVGPAASSSETCLAAPPRDPTRTTTGPTGLTPGFRSALSTSSSTRSRQYFRTVAQLGVQIAEALDHAHTHGILHRDIKPGNLLLDHRGQLWVTDFGLAQIQGHPGLTFSGDMLGTLRYMSPEQALARRVVIDGRTDIYSLGVTLYELLTLRPAIDGEDRQEILRKIAEEEPPRPRRLNLAVPRDLETIVLKAMAKEPSGRYAMAKDLADELERFLEHKPIKARRPSLREAAWRWCHRHSGVASLLGVLTVVLVFGSSASWWAAYHYSRLAGQERRAREAATAAQAQADRRAAENQEVVDFLVNDLIDAAAPSRAKGEILTVEKVLAQADARIEMRFPDRPLIEASVRKALAEAYLELDEIEKAARHAARAVTLRMTHLGPDRVETIAAQVTLGWALAINPLALGEARAYLASIVMALRPQRSASQHHRSQRSPARDFLLPQLRQPRQGDRRVEPDRLLQREDPRAGHAESPERRLHHPEPDVARRDLHRLPVAQFPDGRPDHPPDGVELGHGGDVLHHLQPRLAAQHQQLRRGAFPGLDGQHVDAGAADELPSGGC
jgi:hypothetical protein